jgi:hypothetical protein
MSQTDSSAALPGPGLQAGGTGSATLPAVWVATAPAGNLRTGYRVRTARADAV